MKTNWILMTKAVPKTSERVKVKTADGKEHEGWYTDRWGIWYNESCQRAKEEVKAWVPLDDSKVSREKQAYYFPEIPMSNEDEVSHRVEDVGIYILLNHGEVVYVGQSKHIHHRIYEHQIRHDVDFDTWIYFETDDRMRLETWLIQWLNPLYNVASTNGTDWR